jgi:ApbE superfamily uncharacterized protein (UPF0280 family)
MANVIFALPPDTDACVCSNSSVVGPMEPVSRASSGATMLLERSSLTAAAADPVAAVNIQSRQTISSVATIIAKYASGFR